MNPSVYSLIFLGIITSVVYRLIPVNRKRFFLSISSILVYCLWSENVYAVIVLLADIAVGYVVCYYLSKKIGSKALLTSGIAFIVIVLIFIKYRCILISNNPFWVRISLPLGISYYSFKIISYIIDVYRTPEIFEGGWNYLAYVTFFPQIICGPISRSDEICDYIETSISKQDIEDGLYNILKGVFYKIVIADRLSVYTATVFGAYDQYKFLTLYIAVFLFSVELYSDFAGYSYIVIGICRLMGMRIKENFLNPYFATSIKEFWSRWHISLSSWLKDYIYIPLGGNRKGKIRKNINILVVFLISGLWHGDSCVYIIWGLWHGIWNILSPRRIRGKIQKWIFTFFTFIIVSIGWIPFRLNNTGDMLTYVRKLIKIKRISYNMLVEAVMPFSNDYSCVAKMIVTIVLIILLFVLELKEYRKNNENKSIRTLIYVVLIVFLGIVGDNSFIYANY